MSSIILGSLIGVQVIKILATKFAKNELVKFRNLFFLYFAQKVFAERMVSKIIWKRSWIKTKKDHIIWIALNLVIMVFVIAEKIV